MEVRISRVAQELLKDKDSRAKLYKVVTNGGGEIEHNGQTYLIRVDDNSDHDTQPTSPKPLNRNHAFFEEYAFLSNMAFVIVTFAPLYLFEGVEIINDAGYGVS